MKLSVTKKQLLGIASVVALQAAQSSGGRRTRHRFIRQHRRREKKLYERKDWTKWCDFLSEPDFKGRYKLSKTRFGELCEKVRPGLRGTTQKYAVSAEVCLAATLRTLAGGHRYDISDFFGFRSGSTYYRIFDKTRKCIDAELNLPGVLGTPEEMDERERAFAAKSNYKVRGCVGALDGLAIKIAKPSMNDAAATPYKNRKGFYALNLQAICDAKRRFLWISMKGSGGQHDSMAFKGSQLYQDLAQGLLETGYEVHPRYIAADNAYSLADFLLTPYPGKVGDAEWKDAFNYYLSKMRIEIECAFGMLVNRFGILWKKIEGSIKRATGIVAVCVKLHNFILEEDSSDVTPDLTYRKDNARHFDGESLSFNMYNKLAPDGPYLYVNSGERPSECLARARHSGSARDPPVTTELCPDDEAVRLFRKRRKQERNQIRERLAQHKDLQDFVREEYVKKNRIRRPAKAQLYSVE